MINGVQRLYDPNGNLLSYPTLGEAYKFNPENQLVKITVNGAYAIRLVHNGDGARIKRVDAFGTVHYPGAHYERNVGNGQDTSDVATKLYWAQLGSYRRLIAVRRTVVGGPSDLYFLHHDHLGSTKAISGTSGGPYKYYPFGYAYQEVSNPPTDNLYTGQKRDLSTWLYFYGARYYNGAIGMFIQPDSIVPQPGNPQSLNRYSYVLNNPLRYTDPSGHFVPAAMLLGAVAGAAVGVGAYAVTSWAFGREMTWGEAGVAAGVGAAAGALAPVVATGWLGAGVLGAGANMVQYAGTQWVNNEDPSPVMLGASAVLGGAGGAISGKVSREVLQRLQGPASDHIGSVGDILYVSEAATDYLGEQMLNFRPWTGALVSNIPPELVVETMENVLHGAGELLEDLGDNFWPGRESLGNAPQDDDTLVGW